MWLWYVWDNGNRIYAIYMTPEAAIMRQTAEGYGTIALIPAGEDVPDVEAAIKSYEREARKP